MDECHSKTTEVRKIANGYVKRESEHGPQGYKSTETFHKTHPGMEAGKSVAGAEKVGKSMMKDALRSLRGK